MKRSVIDTEIMRLRALGYNQKETAKKLKITQSAVSYHISKLRKQVKQEGEDSVFFDLCLKVYIPKIFKHLIGWNYEKN